MPVAASETAASSALSVAFWLCCCCCCCCCFTNSAEASSVGLADSSLLGTSLEQIRAQSPYKYVREVILAAEGETKAITCSFDSLYTTGKHWKRTFYSPVVWFAYSPNASSKGQPAREEPIADGTVLRFDGGVMFAYKLLNPMSAAPSSILVLENVPAQLSGRYFICRTRLHPASIQAFYLKVVKPVLFTPRSPSSSGGRIPAQLGGRVGLDCRTGSNFPPASVYWSRRREDARPTARPDILAWGPVYDVTNVTMETAQFIFTCHVNNQLEAEWTANFRLDLVNVTKEPAEIDSAIFKSGVTRRAARPGPVSASFNGVRSELRAGNARAMPTDGESFTLACRVRGQGVEFTWLRNDRPLQPFADPNLYTYSSSIGPEHVTDLIIRKFGPLDRCLYQCVAVNEAGRSRFVFDLRDASTTGEQGTVASRTTPSLPLVEAGGFDGGWTTAADLRLPTQQQQQHLGSGWGAGSGDDDPGWDGDTPPTSSTGESSGDRQPPLPMTTAPDGRRVRRHQLKSKPLLP